jgi:hypothetical protein
MNVIVDGDGINGQGSRQEHGDEQVKETHCNLDATEYKQARLEFDL